MRNVPDSAELCAFDAYGTLFDLASVVAGSAGRLGDAAGAVLDLWRRKQLEYSWLRSSMRRHVGFDLVTADALDHALAVHGIEDAALRADLLASYDRVAPYPDAAPALAALRAIGVDCAVLSNGTPAMLASAIAAAGLEGAFSAVLSVEEVGCFKPDPRVYALLESRTGVARDRVVFVSSNGWDVAGAASFGLRAVRVDRAGAPAERLPGEPWATIPTLADLPALLSQDIPR